MFSRHRRRTVIYNDTAFLPQPAHTVKRSTLSTSCSSIILRGLRANKSVQTVNHCAVHTRGRSSLHHILMAKYKFIIIFDKTPLLGIFTVFPRGKFIAPSMNCYNIFYTIAQNAKRLHLPRWADIRLRNQILYDLWSYENIDVIFILKAPGLIINFCFSYFYYNAGGT